MHLLESGAALFILAFRVQGEDFIQHSFPVFVTRDKDVTVVVMLTSVLLCSSTWCLNRYNKGFLRILFLVLEGLQLFAVLGCHSISQAGLYKRNNKTNKNTCRQPDGLF
jgi:hypothetical protein